MSAVVETLHGLAALVLFVTAAGCAWRIVKGPSLADRILAMDLLAATSAALIIVASVGSGLETAMDPAVVIVAVSFISTVAFSRILETHRDG